MDKAGQKANQRYSLNMEITICVHINYNIARRNGSDSSLNSKLIWSLYRRQFRSGRRCRCKTVRWRWTCTLTIHQRRRHLREAVNDASSLLALTADDKSSRARLHRWLAKRSCQGIGRESGRFCCTEQSRLRACSRCVDNRSSWRQGQLTAWWYRTLWWAVCLIQGRL